MELSNNNYEGICKEIHDSWQNPTSLVKSLGGLTQIECRKVRETYLKLYGEDPVRLLQHIKKKGQAISPQACEFLSILMLSPFERDAIVAREALEQTELNFKPLIEIFTTRKSSHVLIILQAYQARFRRRLDQDIAGIDPSHPYQKILTALSASHKAHQADVSNHIAKCDARRLFQTGEGNAGPIEEAVVLEILCKRSLPQLKLTFSSYKQIYGHSYAKALGHENSGRFEDALKNVVQCICNPAKYYAKVLYGSIKGTTKDKGALTRIIVSRAEIDMEEIRRAFKRKHGMELESMMCESISPRDYAELLVALATRTSAP